jgi:hypothetical protein
MTSGWMTSEAVLPSGRKVSGSVAWPLLDGGDIRGFSIGGALLCKDRRKVSQLL